MTASQVRLGAFAVAIALLVAGAGEVAAELRDHTLVLTDILCGG